MSQQLNLLKNESNLVCTQKAKEALASNTHIKGRIRQYCLMLNCKDSISCSIRQKLSKKIDLNYLFMNGFIEFSTDNTHNDVLTVNHADTGDSKNISGSTVSMTDVSTTSVSEHPQMFYPIAPSDMPTSLAVNNDSEDNQSYAICPSTNQKVGIDSLTDSSDEIRICPAIQFVAELS